MNLFTISFVKKGNPLNKIVFLGDKKIKDKKLKNIIASEENKIWKFISNKVYF